PTLGHFKAAGRRALDANTLFMSIRGQRIRLEMTTAQALSNEQTAAVLEGIGGRSIVFVGLMGAGKTAVGRKVAQFLGLPFIDSDHEIESVSRMSVPDLFENYGEAEFRALEQRVILRILEGGPLVLSTGGGAYMNENTRLAIAER